MTVAVDSGRASYATNGTTGPFTIPFYFLDDTHLQVVHRSSAGVETTLVLNVDYTVTGEGDPDGGALTTTVAYAAGGTLLIIRSVPRTQETDYGDGDRFPAETHERALDKLTMITQELDESFARTLRFSQATAMTGLTLPDLTPGQAFRRNLAGTGFEAIDYASAALGLFQQSGVGAVPRTFSAKVADLISVKDWGATGDGITDDGAAMAAAIAAVKGTGKTLYFPPGTYDTSVMLTIDTGSTHVLGAGENATVIRRRAGASITAVLHVGPTSGTGQVSDCSVKDMHFNGNGGCADAGLKCRNAAYSRFVRLRFSGATGAGLRTDTSTVAAVANNQQNFFDDLYANNNGQGFDFTGEKGSRFGALQAVNNTGVGFAFERFKNDANNVAETTENTIGQLIVSGNGSDAVVFDLCEKMTVGAILSFVNGGYGVRFRSTSPAASGNGTNNVCISTLLSRNDALGGIGCLTADNAFVSGAQFGVVQLIGFGSSLNARGITLDGAADVDFGVVRVAGFPGEGVRIQNGNPLGAAAESRKITFGSLRIVGCGSASASSNHGLAILASSQDIQIGSLYSANNQTSGSDFELATANGAGPILIGTAILRAATATNDVNNTTAGLHFGVMYSSKSGTVAVGIRDGVTAPSANPHQTALIYVDAADGDLKIRFNDGVTKTIVTDT